MPRRWMVLPGTILPADFLPDAWNNTPALPPTAAAVGRPRAADVGFLTDAWSVKPPAPDPGYGVADTTTGTTSPADPALVEDGNLKSGFFDGGPGDGRDQYADNCSPEAVRPPRRSTP
ncbi:hypothetical protein SM007_38260 [Streptomyces avermitilis]|uniref:hypothetical protein n=1 Tax=Streptomyces avermitilis TaxID=33903 RepID=UPI000994320B|nr:hypothetical protein [Streptomyces avermitilis]OOV16683.1 hypothetical protein SM007_38260 [Streptomyces avermitilis]